MRWVIAVGAFFMVIGASGLLYEWVNRDPAFPGDSRWVLAAPDKMELYALDPSPEGYAPNWPRTGTFDKYPTFGVAEIKDAATQRKLVAAIYDDVDREDQGLSKCFEPRHGIRAERGGHVALVEICFTCHGLWIAEGGQKSMTRIKGKSQALFDEALAARGVRPVPTSAEEDLISRPAR